MKTKEEIYAMIDQFCKENEIELSIFACNCCADLSLSHKGEVLEEKKYEYIELKFGSEDD